MHPCLEAELIYRVPPALLSPRTRFHPTLGGDPALCQGLSPQMGLDPKLLYKNILENCFRLLGNPTWNFFSFGGKISYFSHSAPWVCDCDYFTLFHPVSLCFTLYPCVLHFFYLFSIEFVANHALLVALNLSRITHFWQHWICRESRTFGVNFWALKKPLV